MGWVLLDFQTCWRLLLSNSWQDGDGQHVQNGDRQTLFSEYSRRRFLRNCGWNQCPGWHMDHWQCIPIVQNMTNQNGHGPCPCQSKSGSSGLAAGLDWQSLWCRNRDLKSFMVSGKPLRTSSQNMGTNDQVWSAYMQQSRMRTFADVSLREWLLDSDWKRNSVTERVVLEFQICWQPLHSKKPAERIWSAHWEQRYLISQVPWSGHCDIYICTWAVGIIVGFVASRWDPMEWMFVGLTEIQHWIHCDTPHFTCVCPSLKKLEWPHSCVCLIIIPTQTCW